MTITSISPNMHLETYLQKYFGYSSFLSKQKEAIEHALLRKDAVILMPTGGGKSICYQLPAIILDGLTLVISPLIALMKDQVQSLQSNGINAAFLNSSLTISEETQIKSRLENGEIKLLYLSPERISSDNFLDYISTLEINLIAIDEAHCVSSWGHHFRPDYKKLSILKKRFPNVPVLALTATADKAVRSDIGELLSLHKPKLFIASFDRSNLSLAVLPGQKKWEQISRLIRKYPRNNGIIYCGSRAGTEKLAAQLQAIGVQAKPYHAGLKSELRSQIQDDFIQGKTHVICATIAFGMGIDKADVRFVIHYNMPGNLESYYQEIGRAGRDGLPSETILFYSYRDVQQHMSFIEEVQDENYKKIQLAKLKRMQEYAEAQICRRKILMTYFSEIPKNDCGNCDVCNNPPKYFNGTELAQMALSAIARTKEKVGVTTLIEILKGTLSEITKENNYHQIKTFGVGKATTYFEWQLFIQQFIQQGIIEIDYKDHYNLKLTTLSRSILYDGHQIKLVTPETIKERQAKQKEVIKPVKSKVEVDVTLLEHLKKIRKSIANDLNKPAYFVFSDSSLKEMCETLPSTADDFLDITGVGEFKAQRFGETFIKAIKDFSSGKKKGDTYKITRDLLDAGKSISEIAKERNLHETTIYSHLAHLITVGYPIQINIFLTVEELAQVKSANDIIGTTEKLKPFYDHLDGSISYGKIRLALAYLSK